jgi:alkylated DNA repair dioxygenase AlkB
MSLGALIRSIIERHRRRKGLELVAIELEPVAIEFENGSLLIMGGDTQRFWRHQVPKSPNPGESPSRA